MAKHLTEKEAATAFAKAWNLLDPEPFLALLAPDAKYASQWVFQELEGQESISSYLREKMDTVRRIGGNDRSTRVMAELGMTRSEQDCVLIMQGSDKVKTVVVFETDGAHIKRYDTCIPQIMGVRHTGIVPM